MIAIVISKSQGLKILKSICQSQETEVQVITCDDRKDDGRTVYKEIVEFCKSRKLDLLILTKDSLNEYLRNNKPSICIVCGWYWLIEDKSIESCQSGCFGIHNSLLPAYRGGAPLIWSIINGEKEVGSTLFKMTPGLDDGHILYQWKIEITEDELITQILTKIENQIAKNIGYVLQEYIRGNLGLTPQGNKGVSYSSLRSPKDSLVNWKLNKIELFNYFRALQPPYPTIFFCKAGEEFLIKKMIKAPFNCFGKPGKLIAYTLLGGIVCVGNNNEGIILIDVQSESSNNNLIKSKYFKIGSILFDNFTPINS